MRIHLHRICTKWASQLEHMRSTWSDKLKQVSLSRLARADSFVQVKLSRSTWAYAVNLIRSTWAGQLDQELDQVNLSRSTWPGQLDQVNLMRSTWAGHFEEQVNLIMEYVVSDNGQRWQRLSPVCLSVWSSHLPSFRFHSHWRAPSVH